MSALCRFCRKSLFALAIKNFSGFRRDFRVKMWGTSSSDDKLADDLGNTIEGTRISGRRSDFFTAGKLAPGNLGLLQQYLPIADASRCSTATLSESASAVLRLITSLNSVGCSIGR